MQHGSETMFIEGEWAGKRECLESLGFSADGAWKLVSFRRIVPMGRIPLSANAIFSSKG